MHEPWQLVLRAMPDGSAVPTRVWLPPMSGIADGPGRDRQADDLPVQRSAPVPAAVPTAEPAAEPTAGG